MLAFIKVPLVLGAKSPRKPNPKHTVEASLTAKDRVAVTFHTEPFVSELKVQQRIKIMAVNQQFWVDRYYSTS